MSNESERWANFSQREDLVLPVGRGVPYCLRPMLSRPKRWLAHERAPLFIMLLAIVLLVPTIFTGPIMDDHAHQLSLHSDIFKPSGPRGDWDLFRFVDADHDTLRRLMDRGLWPWWTIEGSKLAFFRPISSLWHAFDYRVIPGAHAFMHFESILTYALAILAAGALYRRLLGPTAAAGLATLLFAVDDAHSMVITWIANRHAIISTAFGILTLVLYDRARREQWKPGLWLAPLALAASLFAGESGVATLAYLFAYAVFIEEVPLSARVRSFLPFVGVSLVWFVAYKIGGYGAAGGAFYIDPLGQPLEFFAAVAQRLPVLLAAQLAAPPADAWMALPPGKTAGFVWLCVFIVIFLGGSLFAVLRKDRVAGFFALGMVLCLLPACATWPSDRLLLFSGLGGFGLVASMLSASRKGLAWPTRFVAGFVSGMFVLLHLIIAPVFLPVRAYATGHMLNDFTNRAIKSLPTGETVKGKTLVVVSAPDSVITNMAMAGQINKGLAYPETIRILAPAVQGSLFVERLDDKTLGVTLSEGFWQEPTARVFRDPKKQPMKVGDRIEIAGFTAEVRSLTPDGQLPALIHFTFDKSLDDPSFVFTYWNETRFEPFVLPAKGEKRSLPVVPYQKSIQG